MSTINEFPHDTAEWRLRFSLRDLFVFTLLCGVLFALLFRVLFPALQAAREAARQSQCIVNVKMIGLALANYRDVYGCFPPPYTADANGKPMHSWRVLITPYLESSPFYMQYDFNKPWNSPANYALTQAWGGRGSWHGCPSANQPPGAGFTNYVMIVGPTNAAKAGDTILIAEIADSDIFWSEPRDLTLDEMSLRINDKSKPGISSHHPLGAMVALADGSVKFLKQSTTPEQLRAMLTGDADD